MEINDRLAGMVLPGTDIKICCTGKTVQQNHKDIFFEVLNCEQKKAIRTGYVKIKGGKNEQ